MDKKIDKTEVEKPKYKYLCEGCTDTAIETTTKMVGVKITCKKCQKEQVTKPENYIPYEN